MNSSAENLSKANIVDPGPVSEQRFRLIANSAPCMIWQSDETGGCIFLNSSWLSFTGRAHSEEEGSGWIENVHPDDRDELLKRYRNAFDSRRDFRIDYRLRRHDGQYRWILDQGSPHFDATGTFSGYIGVAIDIHDRRLVEERMRAALREKEVLLRELHHRVKNNMQIIGSLLNRQSRRFEHDQDRALLQEVKDRIRAIALVHERLLSGGNLDRIDMRGYAKDISARLLASFGAHGHFSIEVVADPILLPIESAVPCGLIINELITNSIKHGRGAGENSRIRVGMSQEGQTVAILIEDNGPGFPPNIRRPVDGGAGLELADSLTRQLQGKFLLGNANGAYVCVTFSNPANLPAAHEGL